MGKQLALEEERLMAVEKAAQAGEGGAENNGGQSGNMVGNMVTTLVGNSITRAITETRKRKMGRSKLKDDNLVITDTC